MTPTSTSGAGRDQTQFDRWTTEFLQRFAQRLPRRSFLARAGKVGMGALGAQIVTQVLPLDRRMAFAASNPCTDDWRWCGMYGRRCNCCGGSAENCPPNSTRGSFWTRCCNAGKNAYYFMKYQDCCRPATNPCSCSTASNCTCSNTGDPTPNHYICPPGKVYCCTYWERLSSNC